MMVNSMKAFRLMATFAVAVFLVACEHGGAKVSGGRFIEGNENADSLWTALEGRFQMNNRLDPVEIKVAFLDEKLDSVGELETRLIRQRDGSITFVSDSLDFPTPYLRIAFTCVYPGSSNGLRMDFEQYVDISEVQQPVLSLSGALESERVKTLVQEEGFELGGAKRKALREIYDQLEYEKRRNNVLESDALWDDLQEMNNYLYVVCHREKSDTAFYANFDNLRSALGNGETWRDMISETELADTLFAHDSKEEWTELWRKSFGLPTCDSSNYNDTARATNKNSSYYKQLFVCDSAEHHNDYKWRLRTELEVEKGICTKSLRDTVVFDSLVYICDSAKTKWRNMAEKDAVPYLFGECLDEMEGDTVRYDVNYYACAVTGDEKYAWTKDIPENGKWSNPVNVLVRKQAGVCTDERADESIALDGKYYLCNNRIWQEVDRRTYFLGQCDSLGWDKKKAHHDSVGYFICRKGERDFKSGVYKSFWEEMLIPNYYGDKCTVALENYIKEYDGIKFICKNKWKSESECFWRVAEDNELSVPVRHGKICTQDNSGEVVEYDGIGYECRDFLWKTPSEYHLVVYRAMVRNGYDPEYCRNGSAGTKLFWDDVDSTLYGCVVKYSENNFGWGQVRRASNKTLPFPEFNDPKALLEGVYEDNDHFVINKDGTKFTFYYYSAGVNDDVRRYFRLDDVVPAVGTPLDIMEKDRYTAFRALIGDSTVTLDKIEGKSASFENYFADWKQKIIESTRCPDPTLLGIKCVSDWDESSIEVKFARYNENSYTTWEQASSFCPAGSHIPSAEEWLNENYGRSFGRERATLVKQQNANSRNELFEAGYNLFWTSTEKDSETQYCFEYVSKDNGWTTTFVASGIVECPKDLYPMVQAVCVNDREDQ